MKLLLLISVLAFTPYMPHTEADTQMLADVMWLENGHTGKTEEENRQCLILTGAVVMNRVQSGQWGGDTIKDVIFAKGQYASSTRNGIGKSGVPEWVVELAEQMLTYGTNVPEYVVFQSMQPKLGTVWKVIDNEYFATGGGHKHEGDDFIPEVNRINYRMLRLIANAIGNPDFEQLVRSNMANSWWVDNYVGLRRLAVAYRLGGKVR